ncbi:hypothetical protein EJD88_18460, partial [Pseudomonas sp. PB105]
VDQLLGNGWKVSRGLTGRFLFGRHTCTSINMLCPNTKFMTVPPSRTHLAPQVDAFVDWLKEHFPVLHPSWFTAH